MGKQKLSQHEGNGKARKKIKRSLNRISRDFDATNQTYRDTLFESPMFRAFMKMGKNHKRKKRKKGKKKITELGR